MNQVSYRVDKRDVSVAAAVVAVAAFTEHIEDTAHARCLVSYPEQSGLRRHGSAVRRGTERSAQGQENSPRLPSTGLQ